MPDDIKVAAGIGDDTVAPPVATDFIGGKHYQRIKLGWGPNDTWNEAEDVAGKRIPVTDPAHVAATFLNAGSGTAGSHVAISAAVAGTRLIGLSFRETTGTAGALVILRYGTVIGAAATVSVSLGPNESVREWYGPDGIAMPSGIFMERNLGATECAVYTKVVP
jgi:hypothetical protein